MTYLQDVETYGEEDEKYFRQWEFLNEEDKTEAFLFAAEMEDIQKRHDVVDMNLREVSRVVSEGTLQGMVDILFGMMEPMPRTKDAVCRAEGGGH